MAVLAFRPVDARSHFERAIEGFEELGLTHPAARVRSKLALITWKDGDIERALAELQSAFEVLAGDEQDADLALLAVTLARPLFFTGRIDEAWRRTSWRSRSRRRCSCRMCCRTD